MRRQRRTPVDVRTYFDRQASCYVAERYRRPSCDRLSYETRRRLAVQFLGTGPGRVIDIGSGPGILTGELLSRGYSPWEVDVSLGMLQESRRDLEKHGAIARARFVQGRLPNLPFADRTFDGAVCIGVFAYLEDAAVSLREIRRVLKSGSVLVIQASNVLCPTARLHSILRRTYHRLGEALGGQSYPHLRIPLASFRFASLRRILGEEGFRLESWGYYDFRLPLLEWIAPSCAVAAAAWLQCLEGSYLWSWLAEGMVLKARLS